MGTGSKCGDGKGGCMTFLKGERRTGKQQGKKKGRKEASKQERKRGSNEETEEEGDEEREKRRKERRRHGGEIGRATQLDKISLLTTN